MKPDHPGEKDLGYACVDLDRGKRCGRPEVIFAEGKTPDEVAGISEALKEAGQPVLATRCSPAHFEAVRAKLPEAIFHERARCITHDSHPPTQAGPVGVLCAGTSDLSAALEASVTLEFFGHESRLITDVGVAGLHRLLNRIDEIRSLKIVIVAAGMEGALPSVVAGLVSLPVIAVPTSVGYGAGAGGVAALLGMLTSCGSGVTVVNIDNGFGAACAADRMLRSLSK